MIKQTVLLLVLLLALPLARLLWVRWRLHQERAERAELWRFMTAQGLTSKRLEEFMGSSTRS